MHIRYHLQINANPIDNGFLLNIKCRRGQDKDITTHYCEDEEAVSKKVVECVAEWTKNAHAERDADADGGA